MSLQKVISNYYVDLLDFLGSKYRKYNGNFENYFNNMNTDNKRQLLNKIASVYQRIDILRKSQAAYWKNRWKNQISYVIILVIMIIITAFIMLYLLAVEFNSGTVKTPYQKVTTLLTYLIIYIVIFTLLLLVILNIQENKRQSEAQSKESQQDINALLKLINMQGNSSNKPVDLNSVFLFIGYKSTEARKSYEEVYNANKSLIEPYISKGQEIRSKSNKKEVLGTVDVFNYDAFFAANRSIILNGVKTFYADGEGYNTVRKEVVSSSNILILKEFRRIMEYYYKLVKRKDNAGILTDDKKVKDILNKYVVKEFTLINKVLAPLNPNAYTEITPPDDMDKQYEAQREMVLAAQNPEFMTAYVNLILTFVNVVIYAYQVYLKMSAEDPKMDPALKMLMPQNMNPQSIPGDIEFNTALKAAFVKHAKDKMPGYITSAASASSLDSIYRTVVQDFNDLIDEVYQSLLVQLPGDYYFPVSSSFMTELLSEVKLKESLGNMKLDTVYTTKMIDVLTKQYIPDYWEKYKKTFKDVDARKAALAARISVSMSKFDNIRLMEHQEYIKSQLGPSITPETEPILVEIMGTVDRNVRNKKMSETAHFGRKANDARFLEIDQFIEELDKVTYVDLKVGLNLEFFGDILDKFYFAVNNSIYSRGGSGDRTTKDIYFVANKRMKLASVALNFSIVIIVLCLVYHIMTITRKFNDYRMAKAMTFSEESVQKMKDADKLDLKRQYREVYLNLWMQACIPVAFAVFFICLLQSVYKKAQAKAKFNKETIDTNTSELRAALQDLRVLFEELDGKVAVNQRNTVIKNLTLLGVEEKTTLYEKLKIVIDKFEKCNYVLASGSNDLPFPYTEVIIDGFMVAVIVLCIFWVLGQINPITRIREIKTLNQLKEKGEVASTTYEWGSQMVAKADCHDSDIDSIMFTLKIMFFIFIVMFLIFYATKVLTSTSEYEFGIYNSMYFEESICLD